MTSRMVDAHTHQLYAPGEIDFLYHLSLDEINSQTVVNAAHWAVGLHPWWLKSMTSAQRDQCWDKIEAMAQNASAIGETGIDRVHSKGEIELQTMWFLRHLHLRPSIPLILHNVRAGSDLLGMIPLQNRRRLLLHDYRGGPEETRQWLKREAYFSYGRALLSPSRAVESLKLIPLERLLLETDDGDHSLEFLYKALHEHFRRLSLEDLKNQLSSNFEEFLRPSF